jgi:hypothetical protein
MRKIRQGMEIARLLLDLVGKRERLKQRQLATMQELFEQELLLGEPFELPKTKAKGEKEKEKTTQSAKKETSVTHRRKSTGGAVKATVQQEIDDAVKKSATTSRRKSSTALPDDARKKATAKKKEEEEEEVADADAKRKRSEVEGGNKRPRATKTRRRSSSVESGAEHEETESAKTPAKKTTPAPKKPEARNLSANKVVGDDQLKPRAVYKRKREQAAGEDEVEEDKVNAANEKGKTTARGQDEEQGKKKTATTAEVSPVKRVAKRRRLSASPTKAEPMEEEKVVNIVDSDEDVPAAKASTKGKNVSTRKATPKDDEEGEPEEEGERDDHDDNDESNEGEQDGDDQDYMKGKRKRKRRSLNEVTAQRCRLLGWPSHTS